MTAVGISPSPAPPPRHAAGSAPAHRGPWLVALVTAAIVLVVTATAAFLVRKHLLDAVHARFDAGAAHVTADLRRELLVCAQVLRGTSGLIAAQQLSPGAAPSADSWDRYVTRLALDDAQPCLRTLGYAQVSGDALSAAPGTPLAHIVLMWPQRGDAAAEQSLGTRPETRDALMHAADTATMALAVRPAALDEESAASESPTRIRVDAYYPVYRDAPIPPQPAERRAALAGFIVARIDTEYLFASVAARVPRIDLQVATGTPPNLLYPPRGAPADLPLSTPYFRRSDTLRFGGQTFALTYSTSDPALTAPADFGGSAFFASGCLAALVAGAGVYVFVRRRGETLAEAGAARWLSTLNEARMMAIVRSSSEAIITIDEAQRIVIFNPMAERIFRCSAMDAIGESLDCFIPQRYREGHQKHVQQFGATGVSERQMGRQRVLAGLRADGEEFPVEASISQIADVDGQRKFYTVMLRDVTERMKAENELKASREALRKLSANLQDVREDEKTRIARELHDDLGQQLTALKMDLSSLQQSLEGSPTAPPSIVAQLQGMRRLIDTTVGSVRRIAADLRPVMLDDLGLLPAIEWLINDFTTRYGIEVERRIEPGTVDFSRDGATALFRIMQEALTNVARHAQASRVAILLVVEGEQCLLRIADDGRGAAPDEIESRGEKSFGLLGIRERAHQLDGSISIETAAQRGFILTVMLPLAAIQQEEALP
jgi:PAS domain S-box-containing protein